MAEVVANMVVGPLLSLVKDKASSYLLDQYKVMQGMEEQHKILKRKLPAILDFITDAEQAATHREGAKAWLEELKMVAYQASEVFDEFKYEALRRQAKKNGHYKKLGFHIVKLFPTHNRFVFRNRMGKKLRRIVQTIEVLVTEMNSLGFNFQKQASASKHWRHTDSMSVDPENIASRSREEEKKKIIGIITNPDNNEKLMVLPIVGIGALGKTTLSQLIYNDLDVKKHFQLQSWVCVSDDFDVHDLAAKICQSSQKDTKEKVLEKLQKELNGKRCLLVLDDVWNQDFDKWYKLKACLQSCGVGSVVLATTRKKAIGELMGTTEAHDITVLGNNFIEEIILRRAFHLQQDKPTELLTLVEKFVKRCDGSPLAAKAIGSVLSNKTTVEEWEDVLNKSNICNEEAGILPILKLSYDDLPSEMKQCFAFCAVFPKDYNIDVDKLIQLWIANGFIQEQKHAETIGKRIFDELASRSFFQDVKLVLFKQIDRLTGNYWRNICKIHDLMHDVASSTMGKECAVSTPETLQIDIQHTSEEGSQIGWLPDAARHLFLSCRQPETILNDSWRKKSPAMQTLLCQCLMENELQHLSKYSSLQALELYLKWPLPLKPKYLHHLRYIDLSYSWIKALPEDISILYNLQTLNLYGCEKLRLLPRYMSYMTALRHLYTHGCPKLTSMPEGIRKLTSLRTLTCFVADTGPDCSNVGDLQKLILGGLLELHRLENVTEEDAKVVRLENKTELRELTLVWTADRKEEQSQNDSKVLECLKPDDGMQAIRIHRYGGTTFPTWMDRLQKMAEVHLFQCENVQYLFSGCPSFSFPKLKMLTLKRLSSLEKWWEIDVSQEESIIFPELEKLLISECRKLTRLPGEPTFPKLENVSIDGCPELKTRAKSPKLVAVDFEGPEEEMFLWISRHMASLTNVDLRSTNEKATSLAEHSLRELVDAKEKWNHEFPLVAMRSRSLMSDAAELCACFVQLQVLLIEDCEALVHWPHKEFESMVSLRKLEILCCSSLIGYPEPSASESSRVLPRLETLSIKECENLGDVFNVPASLRKMEIKWCDKLESIFGRQQGKPASSEAPCSGSILVPELPCLEYLCLEYLNIRMCGRLTEILDLPLSLKTVYICWCAGLRSLEFHSGESPSLLYLEIYNWDTLSSLAMGPQAYPCLKHLQITGCPAVETLPGCLQERLDSLEEKYLDEHLIAIKGTPTPRPTISKPKTWKYALKKAAN